MTHRYTHGHHESVLRSHSWRTAENSAGYLLPLLRPGTALLDIGCGPGTITADLASRVAPGPVTAVDAAASVLASARAETGRRGLVNVSFAVADTHHLGFPDDSFDVVHAHQVLQHVADPVAALREMRRVCRPGGHVAVRDSDYHGFVWYPQPPELTEWLDLYQRLARANGGEPDAGRRLLGWARAAGFEEVTASSSTWCFASERGPALVGRDVGRPGAAVRLRGPGPGARRGRRAGWTASPRPGRSGPRLRRAGSPCCTANCSAGSEPVSPSRGGCVQAGRGIPEPPSASGTTPSTWCTEMPPSVKPSAEPAM